MSQRDNAARNDDRVFLVEHLAALIALLAAVVGAQLLIQWPQYSSGGLIDTDSYTRLVRVRELALSGDWFSDRFPDSNAPYGDTMHWTRPLDVVLLALALPLRAVVDFDQALNIAGLAVSPLFHALAAIALLWAARPLLAAEARFYAAVIFLFQPSALSYGWVGRADHHSLLLFLSIVMLGFALRAMLPAPYGRRGWVVAGGLAALGLWISIEFLATIGVLLAALAWRGALNDATDAAPAVVTGGSFAVGTIVALLVERGPGALATEYDRLSWVHALTAILIFAVFAVYAGFADLRSRFRRCLALAGLAGLALAVLALIAPRLFAGPFAAVDPRLMRLFVARVAEMQPLVDFATWRASSRSAGVLLPLVAGFVIAVRQSQAGGRKDAPAWLLIAGGLLLFGTLTVLQQRWGGYGEALAAVSLASLAAALAAAVERRLASVLRLLAPAAVLIAFGLAPVLTIYLGARLFAQPAGASPAFACPVAELAPTLRRLTAERGRTVTIFAELSLGPEIVYRTGQHVVGTPYHRNTAGVVDTVAIETTADAAQVRDILFKRRVDYVLLCAGSPAASGMPWLVAAVPPWLTAIPLPPEIARRATLLEVVR